MIYFEITLIRSVPDQSIFYGTKKFGTDPLGLPHINFSFAHISFHFAPIIFSFARISFHFALVIFIFACISFHFAPIIFSFALVIFYFAHLTIVAFLGESVPLPCQDLDQSACVAAL